MAVVDPFTASHYLGRGIVCRRFEPALPYETAAIFPLHRQRARVVEEFADLAHRIIGESAAAFVNRAVRETRGHEPSSDRRVQRR